MSISRAWHGVTPDIFACVKATSARDHRTKYQPSDADEGTATTEISVFGKTVGTIVLGFDLGSSGTLTYTIREKPSIVSESQIWNGINDTINGCRK